MFLIYMNDKYLLCGLMHVNQCSIKSQLFHELLKDIFITKSGRAKRNFFFTF